MVFLTHIKYEPGEKSQTWRMQNNPRRVTRSPPPQAPTKSSCLMVDKHGVVNPPNQVLSMAYQEVFNDQPPAGVGDIVLPTAKIQRLAREIFADLT